MTETQTTVGVVAESGADERRVALVPKAIAPLVNSGVAVVVQSGAGERALLPESLYTQAGATAKRLGGRTTGYDVRPEVADQVRSVGAQWLDVGIDAAGEGGYARELTEDEKAEQQQALEKAISGFDVVITTALVPGRPAH